MKQSETIAKLTAALVKVQQHLNPIAKDRVNTHFKNSYATLDSIMESVRTPLASVGLAVVQGGGAPVSDVNGNVVAVGVETMLVHESGEYVSSVITLPIAQASPQAVGSAVTYGRRYGVAALLALTTEEDDDGHHATASAQNRVAAPARVLSKAETERALDMAPVKPVHAGGYEDDISKTAKPQDDPACPKCDGAMWDNRIGKKNPKAPDFKCKDRNCDGVVWPPKPTPQRETVPAQGLNDLSDIPF